MSLSSVKNPYPAAMPSNRPNPRCRPRYCLSGRWITYAHGRALSVGVGRLFTEVLQRLSCSGELRRCSIFSVDKPSDYYYLYVFSSTHNVVSKRRTYTLKQTKQRGPNSKMEGRERVYATQAAWWGGNWPCSDWEVLLKQGLGFFKLV